jgi:glutathione S-transferase
MPDPALTFYFAPGSSSMAPHIALHETGVPFDARPLSFLREETRTPDFLALNPDGKVPVLLIDGRPLTEVAAILFWLALRFPEAALLPVEDLESQAQAVSWMSFIAATIHPARRQGIERIRGAFSVAEARLAGREWAIGQYSVADIHLFRLYWRFVRGLPAPPPEYPGLTSHYRRMMQRPAVKRTIAIEEKVGYELPP